MDRTDKEIKRLDAIFKTFKKMNRKERERCLEYITHWHYCEIVKQEKNEKIKSTKAKKR